MGEKLESWEALDNEELNTEYILETKIKAERLAREEKRLEEIMAVEKKRYQRNRKEISLFRKAGNISQAGNCSCGGIITQITHNGVDMHKRLKPKVWYSIELICNKCGYHYDTGRKNDFIAAISMATRVATDAKKLE